jgi:hypothetical protein
MHLTIDWNERHQAYIGVITDRDPMLHSSVPVMVLSVEKANTEEQIKTWYEQEKISRPWETRQ